MINNCGCFPTTDPCCCKEGIMCALHWIWGGITVPASTIAINSVKYNNGTDTGNIENIINITTDVMFIQNASEDIYLSLCNLNYLSFLPTGAVDASLKDAIICRFNNIRNTITTGCCCKNGIIETLLCTKKILADSTTSPKIASIRFSNTPAIDNIVEILAINNDTVWVRGVDSSDKNIYYVISVCEISSIAILPKPSVTTNP